MTYSEIKMALSDKSIKLRVSRTVATYPKIPPRCNSSGLTSVTNGHASKVCRLSQVCAERDERCDKAHSRCDKLSVLWLCKLNLNNNNKCNVVAESVVHRLSCIKGREFESQLSQINDVPN